MDEAGNGTSSAAQHTASGVAPATGAGQETGPTHARPLPGCGAA